MFAIQARIQELFETNEGSLSLPWITRDAQLKKIDETLFGFSVKLSRAMTESKISPGSGYAPGWTVKGLTDLAYGVFAAPSFGKI
jgi:hypothetical protein